MAARAPAGGSGNTAFASPLLGGPVRPVVWARERRDQDMREATAVEPRPRPRRFPDQRSALAPLIQHHTPALQRFFPYIPFFLHNFAIRDTPNVLLARE